MTYLYAFDPTGTLAANKITNEQHILTPVNDRDFYCIIPKLGPFFENGLIVEYQNQQGEVRQLVKNVDYYPTNIFLGASRACAKTLYASITMLDNTLSGVVKFKQYQTLGGEWVLDVNRWTQIVSTLQSNPRTTTWEELAQIPTVFPPIDHEWNLIDMVGMSEVVAAILSLVQALASPPDNGVAAHIASVGNPHQVNKGQVGLSLVENYAPATLQEAIDGVAGKYMTATVLQQRIAALTQQISQYIDNAITSFNGNAYATANQLLLVQQQFSQLATDLGNISKETIGLGLVENYRPATTIEAKEGTATNLVMTPSTTAALISKMAPPLAPAADGSSLVERAICEFTIDDTTFTGAQFTPQGLAYIDQAGSKYLFITVRTKGSSYQRNERIRIVQFPYVEGGAPAPIAFSQELDIGHGQDLTAITQGDDIMLYTSMQTLEEAVSNSGYDIYICAGQSNMVGIGTGVTAEDAVNALIDQWAMSGVSASSIIPATDPLAFPRGAVANTVSPAGAFARGMLSTLQAGRKILLLPVAVSATNLMYSSSTNAIEWAPGYSLYAQMVDVCKATLALSRGNRVAGMIWSQGESDRFLTGVTAEQFRDATVNMMTQLRIDLESEFPIVIGGFTPEYDAGIYQTALTQIELGLSMVPAELPNSVYVDGPAGYAVVGDEIHFTAEGNRLRGTSWSTAMKTLTTNNTVLAQGKGYSKIKWRGALTSQADVTPYRLLGATGSTHRLQTYLKGMPAVSNDGKHILMICHDENNASSSVDGVSDSSRIALIWNRLAVESAVDPLTVNPIMSFRLPRPKAGLTEVHILQGLAADDKYIYTLAGYYNPRTWQLITVLDYSGKVVGEMRVAGVRADYGLDGLLNHPTQGIPYAMEVEGLTLKDGAILWQTTDHWKATTVNVANGERPADIVTVGETNWACIKSHTGKPTYNFRYWTETTKAANKGQWDANTAYSSGNVYTKRTKKVFALKVREGLDGERALSAGIYSYEPGSTVVAGQNQVDVSFPMGDAYTVMAYDSQSNKYAKAFGYHESRRLQIHDHRPGSDPWKYASIQAGYETGREFCAIYSKNASPNAGSWINLYGGGDSLYPGNIHFGSGSGTAKFLFSQAGTLRNGSPGTQNIGTLATKWKYTYTEAISLGVSGLSQLITACMGTPEGHVVADPGSFCYQLDGVPGIGTAKGTLLFFKTSGYGNVGWDAVL